MMGFWLVKIPIGGLNFGVVSTKKKIVGRSLGRGRTKWDYLVPDLDVFFRNGLEGCRYYYMGLCIYVLYYTASSQFGSELSCHIVGCFPYLGTLPATTKREEGRTSSE
jgi:hypothetical protein